MMQLQVTLKEDFTSEVDLVEIIVGHRCALTVTADHRSSQKPQNMKLPRLCPVCLSNKLIKYCAQRCTLLTCVAIKGEFLHKHC